MGIAEEVQSLLETGKLGDASRLILRNAMEATESEFAFVGLLLDGGLLRLLAHDGLKWHATINREFYEAKMQSYRDNGYLDFFESSNLVSAVAHEKKAVLTNTPAKDPRSGGIPSGHPALHSRRAGHKKRRGCRNNWDGESTGGICGSGFSFDRNFNSCSHSPL